MLNWNNINIEIFQNFIVYEMRSYLKMRVAQKHLNESGSGETLTGTLRVTAIFSNIRIKRRIIRGKREHISKNTTENSGRI